MMVAWLVHRNQAVGNQIKIPICKHARSKVMHDGFILDMQIAKHLIRMPPPNKMDDMSIIMSTE